MTTVRVNGTVDEHHQLTAEVPKIVPAGPVTVFIVPSSLEVEAGDAWMSGVAREWADDLNDKCQDIYTLRDGEPVCES